MVFSSVPIYLDPPNWNQQQQQQAHHGQLPSGGGGGGGVDAHAHHHQQHQLPPVPPPGALMSPRPDMAAAVAVSGGGAGSCGPTGGSSVRPGSMTERARLAKIPQPETGLKCPRCESTNTKFCYFNNYSLSQPRHFCKTCRRYWTKGGALRNVPIGGGCRKPRPVPATIAKPAASCMAVVGAAPPLGLGVGVGAGSVSWAPAPQAATAQLMALLSSARGVQGHGGSNVHRLLGLDTMGHLQVLPGAANASGTAPSLWPQAAPRPVPPPLHMDSHLGMGALGHHDVLSGSGLKPPSSSSSSPAASYYSDQLHAVVSSMGRPQAYDDPASLPCTTAVTSLPAAVSSVSAAPSSNTVGLELPPVSLAPPEMQFWSGPTAMSVAWPDLPTANGAFP